MKINTVILVVIFIVLMINLVVSLKLIGQQMKIGEIREDIEALYVKMDNPSIGLNKLTMIKPFVKESNFIEAQEWIDKARDMPTAQLREEIKEINDRKKKAKMTMKDVMIDQFIENMVTFFNCNRKELNFKLALYFQDMDLDVVRDVVRTAQHHFEDDQIKAAEEE